MASVESRFLDCACRLPESPHAPRPLVALVERVQKAEGYLVLATLFLTSDKQRDERDEHALNNFRISLTGYAVSQKATLRWRRRDRRSRGRAITVRTERYRNTTCDLVREGGLLTQWRITVV